MAVVKVENKTYTADSLYQWDKNQVLEIRGLSLAFIPEIHFTNTAMDKALVRQATMDAAGVITVDVPNSLLQKSYKITVFICTYEGDAFRTLYKLEIPVKSRPQPADYTFEDDGREIYSFNALENLVHNAVNDLQVQYRGFTAETEKQVAAANTEAKNAETAAKDAEAAAKDAEAAAKAAQNAAAAEVEKAILKSDIVEIVKVSELPESPAENVLYIIM